MQGDHTFHAEFGTTNAITSSRKHLRFSRQTRAKAPAKPPTGRPENSLSGTPQTHAHTNTHKHTLSHAHAHAHAHTHTQVPVPLGQVKLAVPEVIQGEGKGGGGAGGDVMRVASFRQHAPAFLVHTESDGGVVGREVVGGEALDVVKGRNEEWYSELEGLLKKARDAKRSLETKADRKVACPFKALTGKRFSNVPCKYSSERHVSLHGKLCALSRH